MPSGKGDLIPRTHGEQPLVESRGAILDLAQLHQLGPKALVETRLVLASLGEAGFGAGEVFPSAQILGAEPGQLLGCCLPSPVSLGSYRKIVAAGVEHRSPQLAQLGGEKMREGLLLVKVGEVAALNLG